MAATAVPALSIWMAARQLRQGQVEQTGFVLIDEPAVLLEGLPVLVGDQVGTARRRASAMISSSACSGWGATMHGTPSFRMPAFSRGDGGSVLPR